MTKIHPSRLISLSNLLVDNFEEIASELGIRLQSNNRFWFGACPVHGGDNYSALNLYKTGFKIKGNWRCNTRHCEKKYQPTAIGFVRGVLSFNAGKDISFEDTIKWCLEKLKIQVSDLECSEYQEEKSNFINCVETVSKKKVL